MGRANIIPLTQPTNLCVFTAQMLIYKDLGTQTFISGVKGLYKFFVWMYVWKKNTKVGGYTGWRNLMQTKNEPKWATKKKNSYISYFPL